LTFPRRWLCERVARNIAVTNHVAMRISLPRTLTIYHGTPDSGVRPANDLADNGSELQIGFVGRLVQEKGLPVLLQAAKQLDESGVAFHLTFVGDGPERAKLRGLSTELGLDRRITFKGDLRGADLGDALRAIQVVVMPTESEETAGLAAIEQMMAGGAVIVADIGGLSEVVGDAGLKFPSGNADALASCIRQVLRKPVLASALGSAARSRAVQIFSRDGMIRAHVSVYQDHVLR
ncbi:MAG TPA: glycosyltransferase family 4 protein, partial [Candidatus Acidoferrales bacterium]|nr:glycosyltransferase family 4 protein [Candidatus Acidoferrales bacterium]